MKMRVVRDYDSEKLWMSNWINYGDFPFVFAIRLQYLEDSFCAEVVRDLGKYLVTVLAVSPQAAGPENLESAKQSCGWEGMPETPEALAEMLIDYGTFATMAEFHGNNLRNLLRQARQELRESDFLFGFKMDRPQNAIGSTGWDLIRGDILAGLSKR